jgi:hypothetical protein
MLALVAATACLLAGCESDDSNTSSDGFGACTHTESAQFERLEPLVADVLADEQVSTRRLSGCEVTGAPHAELIVVAPDWFQRQQVIDLLEAEGWNRLPDADTVLESPDGAFEAATIITTEDGSTFVELQFSVR